LPNILRGVERLVGLVLKIEVVRSTTPCRMTKNNDVSKNHTTLIFRASSQRALGALLT